MESMEESSFLGIPSVAIQGLAYITVAYSSNTKASAFLWNSILKSFGDKSNMLCWNWDNYLINFISDLIVIELCWYCNVCVCVCRLVLAPLSKCVLSSQLLTLHSHVSELHWPWFPLFKESSHPDDFADAILGVGSRLVSFISRAISWDRVIFTSTFVSFEVINEVKVGIIDLAFDRTNV